MPAPTRRNAAVAGCIPFRDTNKYATNSDNGRLYIVYSYGPHWPLLVFDRERGQWWANEDKPPSQTTRRHMSQCQPYAVPLDEFAYVSTNSLIQVIERLSTLEDVPW
jgi:hypothetical protein